MGFSDHDPILDFLNDKPFKLKRPHKRRLFESWSGSETLAKVFIRENWERADRLRHPFGLLFKHKFKPKDVVLHLASEHLSKKMGKLLDRAIDEYTGGDFLSRKQEDEILIESYKANVIRMCSNVVKFTLSFSTLSIIDVHGAIQDKLDRNSQRELDAMFDSLRGDDLITFSCHGKGLSLA